jgi:hypothetical protein
MKEIDKVYFHINNGGTTFSVQDEGFGPTIVVNQSHFGAADTTMKLHTTKESLKTLGEMFIKAAEKEYSEQYCHAAVGQSDEDLRAARARSMCCGGQSQETKEQRLERKRIVMAGPIDTSDIPEHGPYQRLKRDADGNLPKRSHGPQSSDPI